MRKKKSKIILLLISVIGLICGCNVTKINNTEKIDNPISKEIITWVIPNLLNTAAIETNVARLNNKLQEDGYGLALKIKSYSSRSYREDIIPLLESGEADIVSVGLDMANGIGSYAQDFIREGYLEELSDYLDSKNGCDLKNWYHEDEWKKVETDGQIYVYLVRIMYMVHIILRLTKNM